MNRLMLVAMVSVTLAGAVRAQDSADDPKKAAALEEARQHVARAKVHYDLGEFKEAADEYIQVYRLRPIPAILFNVAQAYRQGGIYDKARQFYKAYLRESPDAKNKAMIEQSIREMDEMMAKEKRAKEKPPNGVKEPADATLPMQEKTAQKQVPNQKETTKTQVAPPPAPASSQKEVASTASPKSAAGAPASQPQTSPAGVAAPAKQTVALASPRTEPAPGLSRPLPRAGMTSAPAERDRTWTWVAAGATAVALGGGAAFGYKTINGAAPSDARTANILYGAGAVLAIATAALFVYQF